MPAAAAEQRNRIHRLPVDSVPRAHVSVRRVTSPTAKPE